MVKVLRNQLFAISEWCDQWLQNFYAWCVDQDYLQELKTTFERDFGTVEMLRNEIFAHLTQ
jgi:hypothetical protein